MQKLRDRLYNSSLLGNSIEPWLLLLARRQPRVARVLSTVNQIPRLFPFPVQWLEIGKGFGPVRLPYYQEEELQPIRCFNISPSQSFFHKEINSRYQHDIFFVSSCFSCSIFSESRYVGMGGRGGRVEGVKLKQIPKILKQHAKATEIKHLQVGGV